MTKLPDLELKEGMLKLTDVGLGIDIKESGAKLMGTEGRVVIFRGEDSLLLLRSVTMGEVLVAMFTAFFVLFNFFSSFSTLFFSCLDSFKSSFTFLTVFKRFSFFCSSWYISFSFILKLLKDLLSSDLASEYSLFKFLILALRVLTSSFFSL